MKEEEAGWVEKAMAKTAVWCWSKAKARADVRNSARMKRERAEDLKWMAKREAEKAMDAALVENKKKDSCKHEVGPVLSHAVSTMTGKNAVGKFIVMWHHPMGLFKCPGSGEGLEVAKVLRFGGGRVLLRVESGLRVGDEFKAFYRGDVELHDTLEQATKFMEANRKLRIP